MELNTVLLIGKPGSGKGTQAKLLSEKSGFPVIASGDLFRALIAGEDHIAARMKEEHEKGLLAPDWFATYLFQKSILSIAPDAGIIFDGFGRKAPEAKVVIDVLNWLERPFTAVHIKVEDENIRERLALRSQSSGRADDNAVEKRLEEYRLFTDPAIEVFREAGKLVEIDGNGTIPEIHEAIVSGLHIK